MSHDTKLFDGEDFRLRVERIVYTILGQRDLTVPEVKRIEDAISNALEMIIVQKVSTHSTDCRDARSSECQQLLEALKHVTDQRISTAREAIFETLAKEEERRKQEVDRTLNRIYVVSCIMSAIIGACTGLCALAIKVYFFSGGPK